MGKTLVVGDIHGCYNLLVKGLKQANYQPGWDRLIFLGDYIDRGYESAKVVQLVKELVTEGAIALRGNHEQMLLDTIASWDEKRDYWFLNGGKQTLLSYGVELSKVREEEAIKKALPCAHLDFLQTLPFYLEDDEYIYCHAGIRPGVPLEKQTREDLLWIRDSFLSAPNQGKTVIFGHTPTMLIEGHGLAEVYRRENKIGIDTGAYFSGFLTVLPLSSNAYQRRSA